MLDFFRGTLTARAILDHLDHLPRTSAYHCAVAADEELAAQVAASDEVPKPSKTPPLSEYTPEVEALRDIQDILDQTLRVLVKVNNGKPGKHKPYPRPVTALGKALNAARDRLRLERHRTLTKRLLPGRN